MDSDAQDTTAKGVSESCRADAQDVDLARLDAERRGAIETIRMMAGNLRASCFPEAQGWRAPGMAASCREMYL
jgi:hypothetical protein